MRLGLLTVVFNHLSFEEALHRVVAEGLDTSSCRRATPSAGEKHFGEISEASTPPSTVKHPPFHSPPSQMGIGLSCC